MTCLQHENDPYQGASPCEKSEEKGQRQKVKILCLNMFC